MKHSREQNREETDEIKCKGMSLRKTADGRRVALSVGFLLSTDVSQSARFRASQGRRKGESCGYPLFHYLKARVVGGAVVVAVCRVQGSM